jgi:hypothetical protein
MPASAVQLGRTLRRVLEEESVRRPSAVALGVSTHRVQVLPHLISISAAVGIGRHVSGVADRSNGHIDEFRVAHIQRSDGWS